MYIKSVLAVLLAVSVGSVSFAADPGAIVSVSIERLAASSPQEKVMYVTQALAEMRSAQTTMQRIGNTAPECVETRLPLLNQLIEMSNIAVTEMNHWQLEGNTLRADTELRKVAAALTKVRSLLAETKTCSTDESDTLDENSRRMEYIGPELAEGDETALQEGFVFDGADDPPEASPFI